MGPSAAGNPMDAGALGHPGWRSAPAEGKWMEGRAAWTQDGPGGGAGSSWVACVTRAGGHGLQRRDAGAVQLLGSGEP